ncbi:vWA domain-containing protein [Oceanomicrobium pacificus]|uniref:VWA domain-containing protein n=1 Tax=Oceanomicrobium pacificus TaxID=2692916 RepID=A0A6B0TL61_9RHOB|nr:VWA domain-containing protein [Oceanomicrobium pacificus]MXU65270.1 VWA domain-containing protein [Oceanomicrobium pacificus]
MTSVLAALSAFHLIRPEMLLLLAPVLVIWWRLRQAPGGETVEEALDIAPHLRAALQARPPGGLLGWLRPADTYLAALVFTVLAAAGPAWDRIADPDADDALPVVIVLETGLSMTSNDIDPTRLARAKLKIRDLIDGDTKPRRRGLVAYAGTAHRVVPLSDDPALLRIYLDAIGPATMPEPHDARPDIALELAAAEVDRSARPAAILLMLDDLANADRARIAAVASGLPTFAMIYGTPDGGRQIDPRSGAPADPGAPTDPEAMAADLADLSIASVPASRDGSDLQAFTRWLDQRSAEAALGDGPWRDRGRIFLWPAAFFLAFGFRRGWVAQPALAVLLFLCFGAVADPLAAQGQSDVKRAATDPAADAPGPLQRLFLTPDQQGRLAYQNRRFATAATRFEDPAWKAQALYRDGQYLAAGDLWAAQPGAQALAQAGTAYVKGREYDRGVALLEAAVEADPTLDYAVQNLETARAIRDTVMSSRQAGATEIGADEIRYDASAEVSEGARSRTVEGLPADAVEQWMRTVDTSMSDFLRSRFALEAAQGGGQ